MAGAGYKLFNTGDVLTAAQVNTYLQEQTVMVFANSTARTTALSGVLAEGMVSYLQDTNAVEVYNGSAWVGVSGAGDVTEVQAGTGISVASGTGPIPVVTNTMATEITAAGDIIVGTGSATFDNLPIGSTGQVLTADTTVSPYKVKWAAPSAGALTYITGASFTTASSVSLPNDTFTSTYENYVMKITFTAISANNQMCYRMRASGTDTTSAIYYWSLTGFAINNTAFTGAGLTETSMKIHNATSSSDYDAGEISIYSPKAARQTRLVAVGAFASNGGTASISTGVGFTPNTTAYDALTFFPSTGTMTGFYKVYGIANS